MNASKSNLKKIELINVIGDLPDAKEVRWDEKVDNSKTNIFICALGFESRCLEIPHKISENNCIKCDKAIIFEYSTNIEENQENKSQLIDKIEKFCPSHISLKCDEEDFLGNFTDVIKSIILGCDDTTIYFDISVCSSKLLVNVLKKILELSVYLKIFYSEADIYHPTFEEFNKNPDNWMNEEKLGLTRGVDSIVPSSVFPGSTRENPDLIVVFPTFKPERTKAIITYVDESIALKPEKRTVWMLGKPHMDKKIQKRRMEMIKKINNISKKYRLYEVSTFNYKDTLNTLEKIYLKNNLNSHINISALGSKMQSIGVTLFCTIRPDVSVYHAIPEEYNPTHYSEGCKKHWIINFGNLDTMRNLLNKVGTIKFQ